LKTNRKVSNVYRKGGKRRSKKASVKGNRGDKLDPCCSPTCDLRELIHLKEISRIAGNLKVGEEGKRAGAAGRDRKLTYLIRQSGLQSKKKKPEKKRDRGHLTNLNITASDDRLQHLKREGAGGKGLEKLWKVLKTIRRDKKGTASLSKRADQASGEHARKTLDLT